MPWLADVEAAAGALLVSNSRRFVGSRTWACCSMVLWELPTCCRHMHDIREACVGLDDVGVHDAGEDSHLGGVADGLQCWGWKACILVSCIDRYRGPSLHCTHWDPQTRPLQVVRSRLRAVDPPAAQQMGPPKLFTAGLLFAMAGVVQKGPAGERGLCRCGNHPYWWSRTKLLPSLSGCSTAMLAFQVLGNPDH